MPSNNHIKTKAGDQPEASTSRSPTSILTGKYVCGGTILLGQLIGKGGFGQVYRAEVVSTLRPVAVKVVNRPTNKQASLHRHLDQEIKIHGLMSDDPAVPSLYRVDEDEEYVYLVMEYCETVILGRFVRSWKRRSRDTECFEKKRAAMLQLIDVVGRCHDRSVFHRDIKPENILIREDGGSVRLIDFGLAVATPISSNCRSGTKEYMSPECYSEYNFNPTGGTPFSSAANDVWSLGAVLFFLMVGEKLWAQPTFSDPQFATYASSSDIYFLMKYGVTEDAQRILSKSLEWDPKKRLDLREFRTQLSHLPRFFVSQEEAAVRFFRLRANPTFRNIDVPEAHREFKRFFLKRSKLLGITAAQDATAAAVGDPGGTQLPFAPSVPPTRPLVLRDVYAYADSLAGLREGSIGPNSEMLAPPSFLLASGSNLSYQRSFESSVLQTPPLNRPIALQNIEIASSGDGPQTRMAECSSFANLQWAGSAGSVAQVIRPVAPSHKPKKKGILFSVSGVFRFAGRGRG